MKRVVVTGANGFVGRYVTERLHEAGFSVYAIIRHRWDRDDVNCIITDLTDEKTLSNCKAVLDHADIMVHLAADISVPGDLYTVGNNIKAMESALEISKVLNISHFILLSSVPVIGKILYTPIDENHPVLPKTLYHWSKYMCEIMLDKNEAFFETSTVIRIPSPIGVGMRHKAFLSMLLDKMKKNDDVEIYGDGGRVQSYIDVRDLAQAVYDAIQKKSGGLFLLAGDSPISNIQLALLARKIVNSDSEIITGLNKDPEESDRWIISTEKAHNNWGYISRKSIEDTIRWMSEELY